MNRRDVSGNSSIIFQGLPAPGKGYIGSFAGVPETSSDHRPEILSLMRHLIADFRLVFVSSIIVFVLCWVIFLGSVWFPGLNDFLVASPRTPWGVITSLFAHSGIEHITVNMVGLFAFSLLFAVCNSFPSDDEKKRRASFFLIVSFVIAVASNLLWIALIPQIGTIGASGIVYASEGVITGFALMNGLMIVDWRNYKVLDKHSRTMIVFNLSVLAILLVQGVFSTGVFLNTGEGVNTVVHGLAFLFSFLLTLCWVLLRKKTSAHSFSVT